MSSDDSEQPKPRSEGHRWQPGESGNPKGRPEGSGALQRIRKLLEPHREDLVKKVVEMAKAGDMGAMRIVMERLGPPPRAESEPVHIPELAQAETLTDGAKAVIAAIGNGDVSPTAGLELLSAIGALVKVIEADDVERRLQELEGKR